MGAKQTREKNPNWQGGRVIASNGYVLVKVGTDHHLADVRGYAYEHRLVAEKKIGRRLAPGEIVHHKDENKQNNEPDNLEVVAGIAEHFVHHRKRDDLQLPGEPNPDIACACGCGTTFPKYDPCGRPRQFVTGHNRPEGALTDMVLFYLDNVPEPSTAEYIASFFGLERRKVTAALSRLKSQGKATRSGHSWRSLRAA